ncbi:MAG: M20/M25/M40 family metallo-hydrolase [Acidobacteriota bacterium]|nr:M20/M25/M40 family metallo-hydrolase [Acidobacteriota bacterium]
MDDLFRYLREIVDIPSVTGDEGAVAERVAADLEAIGLDVECDEAAPGRPNLIARAGQGPTRLWYCTHLDTVPPFFASSETATHVAGRGSCDAKGILAAMLFAARRLREDGISGFGMAFTVGEEVDSAGAIHLEARGPGGPAEGVHLVCGEPTEGLMASGHKGTLRVRIRARGKAAHSAYPEAGDSAVHRLLATIAHLQSLDWGKSEVLGAATLNVGVISGGVAGNVLAPAAEATLYWRLVGEAGPARRRLEAILGADDNLSYEHVGQNDAVLCRTLPGFAVAPMSYSTDIPFMPSWGTPLLIGPGSIHDAHTAHEHVLKRDLVDAVGYYQRIAHELL